MPRFNCSHALSPFFRPAIALALLACEVPGPSAPVPPPDAAVDSGAIGSGAAPDGDGKAQVQPADATPVSCNPIAWNAELHKGSPAANPSGAGAPPYDKECKPALDKKCQTACDCKFVFVDCGFDSASITMPWTVWKPALLWTGPGKPNAEFVGNCVTNEKTCAVVTHPKPTDQVACLAQQCTVISAP